MAKASLTLSNGTTVQVEGSVEEVQKLLQFYGGKSAHSDFKEPTKSGLEKAAIKESSVDLAKIVNLAKDCEEADKIETQILDRSSQVDRTLLPLYVVHEHLNSAFGLTSGEISKITANLGIPISQSNVSHTLSGTASRYVIGDTVKTKGQPVRYRLSRRGVKYVKAVLEGVEGEK